MNYRLPGTEFLLLIDLFNYGIIYTLNHIFLSTQSFGLVDSLLAAVEFLVRSRIEKTATANQ